MSHLGIAGYISAMPGESLVQDIECARSERHICELADMRMKLLSVIWAIKV